MVVIRELEIKQKYYYIWLKYVRGFNLAEHCAKCLLGTYEKQINRDTYSYKDIVLQPSEYYYFCAVSSYKDNIHLAFIPQDGERIEIDNKYYKIIVENARQIKFDESRIDPALKGAQLKEFYSCRNWQFANWVENGRKSQ